MVDWNAEVAAHPDYVYADAIHLTATGQPAMAAAVRDHFDRYVASLTPTTTPAPSTAPSTSIAPAPRAASGATGVAGASDSGGLDDRALALGAVAVLLLVGGVLLTFGRSRRNERRDQRRESSSARSPAASVTGSRQAKRSHT